MPFWNHIPVPELPDFDPRTVRLVDWLVQDGEEFHAGTKLAILETSTGRFAVLANGYGFIRERLILAGAQLTSGTPLATADADGENIPYRKPYSLAQRISSTRNTDH